MYYLLVPFLLWAVFISYWLYNVLNHRLKFILDEDVKLAEKHSAFRRTDIPRWNHLEMYFCAIFFMPFRVIFMVVSVLVCWLGCIIVTRGEDLKKPLPPLKREIVKKMAQISARLVLLGGGYWFIDHRLVQIGDFDPTYPKTHVLTHKGKRAPIVISNHVSWADIPFHIQTRECPSFISKHGLATTPILKTIGFAVQCLFVNREDNSDRDQLLEDIKSRLEIIEKSESMPPLIIFPEGTTTNGKALISFKKGAFAGLTPIKIYCLKYDDSKYSTSLDVLNYLSLLLALCQFKNSLTVYEFDTFYPDHLRLGSEDWEKYAAAIKKIMLKCLNVEDSNQGFRDKSAYFKNLEDQRRSALRKKDKAQ